MHTEPIPPQRATLTGSRPPWAPVVHDVNFANRWIDWSSWYLTEEEDRGESTEQAQIIHMFLSILSQLSGERQWKDVFFSGDQFFAWRQDEPFVRVSPDIYMLDHPPSPPFPPMWETWRPGHSPPRFAVEIVSLDWKKDYEQAPAKYAQLGTKELVIFDPEIALNQVKHELRFPLQVYRRDEDGVFARSYAGSGPAYSEQLNAWLVVYQKNGSVRLRLARDALGLDLIPTIAEQKEAAEQRVCELEEELRRYQNK